MKRIYEAANNVEAHMIVHMLEQAGIHGHIDGEHLQSGAGELPLGGLVAVSVNEDDVASARAVIREWEQRSPPPPTATSTAARTETSSLKLALTFFAGAFLGGGLVWSVFNGPESIDTLDRNGDGKSDHQLFYNGSHAVRAEVDRNFDGRTDAIEEYGHDTLLRSFRSDDDFDGRLESVTTYRGGEADQWRIDSDGDGRTDYRVNYRFGVIDTFEYLQPASDRVVKRVTYRGSKQERAEVDLDGDGHWERSYGFDRYDEPVAE